jgi:hypothetical protein
MTYSRKIVGILKASHRTSGYAGRVKAYIQVQRAIFEGTFR